MATNSQGSLARYNTPQQIDYLRKAVTFADAGKTVTVGILPPNAVILKAISGVFVGTVFNAGTTNTLDVGTTADGDLYGTALSLTAANFVPLDEAVSFKTGPTGDTYVTATVSMTGTAATTGSADIIVAFVPNNDQ
jgi:hypothetical protein